MKPPGPRGTEQNVSQPLNHLVHLFPLQTLRLLKRQSLGLSAEETPSPSSIQSCILSLEIAGRMETIYEPSGNTCSQYSSPPAHQEILEQPFCRKQKKI